MRDERTCIGHAVRAARSIQNERLTRREDKARTGVLGLKTS